MAATRLLKTVDDGSTVEPMLGPAGSYVSGLYRRKASASTTGPVVTDKPGTTVTNATKPSATPVSGANAKTIEFDKPGAGNAAYGIDAGNVFAKFDTLRAHQGEKAGGSQQAWDNLTRWTTTPQVSHLGADQISAYNDFVKTGNKSPNLKTETVLAATDWTFRDIGRSQQHKPPGFLDSVLGQVVVFAAEVAAGIATGGAAVPALIGAGVGGIRGGVKGAAFGAVSGYGAGSLGAGISAAAGGSITAPANGAGITATGGSGAGAAAANAGANIVNGVRTVAGAATSGFNLGTAASVVNAGLGVKTLLAGAGAGVVAATATTPGKLDTSTPVTPPIAGPTAQEKEADMQRRRRIATQTDLTWGRTLNAPLLSKPTLLGGPTRLAA